MQMKMALEILVGEGVVWHKVVEGKYRLSSNYWDSGVVSKVAFRSRRKLCS